MSRPQSGILPEGNQHALFITLEITSSDKLSRSKLANIPQLTAQLSEDHPDSNLSSVVGIGSHAWDQLFAEKRPKHLEPFRIRRDGGRVAPATAGDLLLHIRSERPDVNFILARLIMGGLGSAVKLVEEVSGYRYLDSRDMTGFIDGTENPEGEHRAEVALVQDEVEFAAGSYISMQRYIHDLSAWEQLPVHAQEAHIGRTKADDIQLRGEAKPPSAHISRAVVEEEGEELEILRHSMPYGGVKEAGLLFIAYARQPDHFDKMLDQMIMADQDGVYDHLLDYTSAVTGNNFFAPSLEFLLDQSSD